jgi:hypothetical protein
MLFQTPLFQARRQRHLIQTRANGSPAFGLYQWEAQTGVYQLFGLVVLDVVGEQIAHIVAFLEPESFSSFALPPTLPSSARQSTPDEDFTVPSPTRDESKLNDAREKERREGQNESLKQE